MTEWLPVFKDLGFPPAFVLLVAWKIWPFIVEQLNKAQAERKETAAEIKEISAEFVRQLDRMGERQQAGFTAMIGKITDLESTIHRKLDR